MRSVSRRAGYGENHKTPVTKVCAMAKICVIEDDNQIRLELVHLLQANAYECYAPCNFTDPDELMHEIVSPRPDLLLLDLGLPSVDGNVLAREFRQSSTGAIIVLTSRNSELDELVCLSSGADDFIAKPYNPQILLAHIASVLRRAMPMLDKQASVLRCGPIELNLKTCTASAHGKTIELTKNELKILTLLIQRQTEVVSRTQIQEALWQSDEYVDDNTLTVNVSHLRQRLAYIGEPHAVVTHRGLGYRILPSAE